MATSRGIRSRKGSKRREDTIRGPKDGRRARPKGGVDLPSGDGAPHLDFPIVGVGASAGGVEAAQDLFSRIPPDSGLAFVLILHLDPTRESLVDRVIAARPRIPVVQAGEGAPREPKHIYVAPPGHPLLTIHEGVLSLGRHQVSREDRLPIDGFLSSLALDKREHAACVILSGSGSDGARGVREIVAAGRLAIVQDPLTAPFHGLPPSALPTGPLRYVLPVHA